MNEIFLFICERCSESTESRYIMTPNQDGTWTEKVDGSPLAPSDLHCCYDCSEELEPPLEERLKRHSPVWDDDDDTDPPTRRESGEFTIYLLLRNQRIVYVGKDKWPPSRLDDHSKKGWIFDDMIETADGPYSEAEALRKEEVLIQWYNPEYNKQHKVRLWYTLRQRGWIPPQYDSESDYLMLQAVEAARLEARRQ